METIQERIKKIIVRFYRGKVSLFYIENGINKQTLINIIGGRNSDPSSDIIAKIIGNKKLNISPDWLLLGTGEIQRQVHLLAEQFDSSKSPERITKDMLQKDEIITQMRERIILLEYKIYTLSEKSENKKV